MINILRILGEVMIRKKLVGLLCIVAFTFGFISCGQEKKDDSKDKASIEESNNLESSNEDKKDDDKNDQEEETEKDEEEENESTNESEEVSSDSNLLKGYGHYMKAPEQWEEVDRELIEQLFGEISVSVKGAWMLDEIGSNVTIVTERNELLSFNNYVDISQKNITSQEDFEDMKEIEYKTINDVDIALLDYTAKDETRSVKIQQVIFSADKDIFIITLTNGTNSEDIQKSFDEFINTLKKI